MYIKAFRTSDPRHKDVEMWTGFTIDVIWMNTEVCSVTSEPSQTNSKHVLSFKVSYNICGEAST